MEREFWRLMLKSQSFLNTLYLTDVMPLTLDRTYDNIIADLSCLNLRTKDGMKDLIEKAFQRINAGGSFGLYFKNRYDLKNILRYNAGQQHFSCSLHEVTKSLSGAGFKKYDTFVFYPDQLELVEIDRIDQSRHAINSRCFADFIKSKILRSVLLKHFQPAYIVIAAKHDGPVESFIKSFVKTLRIDTGYDFIYGKPNMGILLSDETVFRIPLDALSRVRSRLCQRVLTGLCGTSIAQLVPSAKIKGSLEGLPYYGENRLQGYAIDKEIDRMDELVVKAAERITAFQKETATILPIDEKAFRRLFLRDFQRLGNFVNDDHRHKLDDIVHILRVQFMNKSLTTVWSHGDYKIENVLFDTDTWRISGIIDWDLSRKQGFPLVDILFLLLYRDRLKTGKEIVTILRDRFLRGEFNDLEKQIIGNYMRVLNISEDYLKPMCIMFWVHHIMHRCRQQLAKRLWKSEEELPAFFNVVRSSAASAPAFWKP